MSVKPLVSVVMPMFNAEDYIAEAVNSLITQSYSNLEFVVVDDASSDRSAEILRSLPDARICYVRNESNLGVARSLLKGIDVAQGDFIARMDSDDVCLPRRFERQMNFLSRNPEVDILGGAAIPLGARGRLYSLMPSRDEHICANLLFRSSIIHPSVMLRRASFDAWYDPEFTVSEDYEFWVRSALMGFKFANLRWPLIRYRYHAQQVSQVKRNLQQRQSSVIRGQFVRALFGQEEKEVQTVLSMLAARSVHEPDIEDVLIVVDRILSANRKNGIFDEKALRSAVERELVLSVLPGISSSSRASLSAGLQPVRKIARRRPRLFAESWTRHILGKLT